MNDQQHMPHNPYDFITAQPHAKKSGTPLPTTMRGRIIFVAAIASIVVIIGLIIVAVAGNSGADSTERLTRIVQTQTELTRVASIGAQKARSPEASQLAATVSLTVASEQQSLQAAMKDRGIIVSPKQLGVAKNAQTDAALTTAEQTNQFDAVFIQTMTTQLIAYRKQLKIAYDEAKSAKIRQELNRSFTGTNALLPANARL